MKCWVQSIQMRRWRALIHPALLAPDGLSGEVRQWQDLSFLLRLCPPFMCDSRGACSRRRTTVTSRHLVMIFSIYCSFFSFIWCSIFTFHQRAALMAILAFRFLACTSLFVHGHHALRERSFRIRTVGCSANILGLTKLVVEFH